GGRRGHRGRIHADGRLDRFPPEAVAAQLVAQAGKRHIAPRRRRSGGFREPAALKIVQAKADGAEQPVDDRQWCVVALGQAERSRRKSWRATRATWLAMVSSR